MAEEHDTKTPLAAVADGLRGTTRDCFERDGVVEPLLFLNIKDNDHIIITPLATTPADKGQMGETLFRLIQEGMLLEYVTLTEAWMSVGDEAMKHRAVHGTISDFPNRKGIVVFLYASPAKEELYMAEITHPPDQPPQMGPWIADQGNMQSVAVPQNFSGLFARAAAHNNRKDPSWRIIRRRICGRLCRRSWNTHARASTKQGTLPQRSSCTCGLEK